MLPPSQCTIHYNGPFGKRQSGLWNYCWQLEQMGDEFSTQGAIMQMNTIIWVYVAVHLADESAVGAINRPLRSITGFMCSSA